MSIPATSVKQVSPVYHCLYEDWAKNWMAVSVTNYPTLDGFIPQGTTFGTFFLHELQEKPTQASANQIITHDTILRYPLINATYFHVE